MTTPLLSVRDLVIEFPTRHGPLTAVDGVSFDLAAGEVLGVVGESGAGKSLTGSAIIGLLDPPGHIASGEVYLKGERIDNLRAEDMRAIRGRRIGMVFQDPLTSLNPLYTIADQLIETIRTHLRLSEREARQRAIGLLDDVGIPAASRRIDDYPHQFSGGMRQRVAIALALALNPKLVIADEPVTALDVIVQRQILDQLRELQQQLGISVILVTHDISVVAYICDRTVVMYAGRVAEQGTMEATLTQPSHPYTMGLRNAFPDLQGAASGMLTPINGAPPNLALPPPGCRFAPRCPFAIDKCTTVSPETLEVAAGHGAACHRADEASKLRKLATRTETWVTTEMAEA